MNLNFELYVGGKGTKCDRNQLADLPTPAPIGRWSPIPHVTLVNELEKALLPFNMRVSNEVFKLDKGGARMFGLLQIENCNNNPDFSFVAGVRNSHDKMIRAGVAIGEGTFVCSNLRFSGEIVIGRKHTKEILNELPDLITGAVGKLSEGWSKQADIIQKYKEVEVTPLAGRNLLVECAKQLVFPRTQYMDVLEEFESPRHPEFKDRNLWSLMNAVTEVLKPRENSSGSTLWVLPARTARLNIICNEFAGISAFAPEIPIDVETELAE